MTWFINDLSLQGQFTDIHGLRSVLEPLLKIRNQRPDLKSRILCSRTLSLRPVIQQTLFYEAVQKHHDANFRRLILTWFANGGPFWEDSRAENPEDYFHFDNEDVTNQGLGEAARRKVLQAAVGTYSFVAKASTGSRFETTPLVVSHGLPEDPQGKVPIPNLWNAEDLLAASEVAPSSWIEMITLARSKFPLLRLPEYILEPLRPEPFEQSICDASIRLLGVLQQLAQETLDDSSLSAHGMLIKNQFFTGHSPAFTDESDSNKEAFRRELSFPDPDEAVRQLSCTWHGKIKHRYYRIHFEWPRPKGQRQIKVVYIGPKITKD